MTRLTTPSGTPASAIASNSWIMVSGVWSAGRLTTVQPAASAGAIFRLTIAAGKFHGVMVPTTPTGCLIAWCRLVATVGGMIRPYARFPSSANHSKVSAVWLTSPLASGSGLPCSWVKVRAITSTRSRIRSAVFLRILARSYAVVLLQVGNAWAAAATARSASARPP